MPILNKLPILKRFIDMGYATLFIIILSAVVGFILALPVMFLWNFVFGSFLRISVLQAWALNVLAGILFGQRNSNK